LVKSVLNRIQPQCNNTQHTPTFDSTQAGRSLSAICSTFNRTRDGHF
jgi:hypothetical protein